MKSASARPGPPRGRRESTNSAPARHPLRQEAVAPRRDPGAPSHRPRVLLWQRAEVAREIETRTHGPRRRPPRSSPIRGQSTSTTRGPLRHGYLGNMRLPPRGSGLALCATTGRQAVTAASTNQRPCRPPRPVRGFSFGRPGQRRAVRQQSPDDEAGVVDRARARVMPCSLSAPSRGVAHVVTGYQDGIVFQAGWPDFEASALVDMGRCSAHI